MNLDDWHFTFSASCILVLALIFTPLASFHLPKTQENFFALALLGEEGLTEGYYPDEDSNIQLGERVRWNVYIYNHMDSTHNVLLKVKVLNLTLSPPDSITCTPSPVQTVHEINRFIYMNGTLIEGLNWEILEVAQERNYSIIKKMIFNGEEIELNTKALNGYNFRVVIELWVYVPEIQNYSFSWPSGGEVRCVWNQIWFNSTI